MSFNDEITMAGAGLSLGEQSPPMRCPICRAQHEEKFSIKRVDDGFLYNCFRGKCGASGFVSTSGGWSFQNLRETKPSKTHKRYDNSVLKGLDTQDYAFFRSQWGLRNHTIASNVFLSKDDEYVFRIRDVRGRTRGWHVRQPRWKGVECHRKGVPGPKGMTYKDTEEGLKLAWIRSDAASPVVIVEDYLSALKIGQAGFNAVCIFGTHLSKEDVSEVASVVRNAGRGSVLWLDADAQGTAMDQALRYGVSLDMRVVSTTKDPKAMSGVAIAEVIG